MGEHLGESRMLREGGLLDQPLAYFRYQSAAYLWYVIKTIAPAEFNIDQHPDLKGNKALIDEINAAFRKCRAEMRKR